MKVLQLIITDLKRISVIEICPKTGKPIILTGDNAQGKSSVLDALVLALDNTGLDDPVRHGRPSGSVKLILGADKAEYLLERRIPRSGAPSLILTDMEGRKVDKPQTFLNGLIGNYAFDPLEFNALKSKDQVEALKKCAGLDFAEVDAERKTAFDDRTAVTKEGKELAAQLAAVPAPADDCPTEEVSAVDLIAALNALEDQKRKKAALSEELKRATTNHTSSTNKVEELAAKLREAKVDEQAFETAAAVAKTKHEAAPEPTVDEISAATAAINNIEATNRAVRSAAKHRDLTEKAKAKRLSYASLDAQIKRIDERKSESVKNANLPIKGLELTDEGVMFNGTFFSQLSTAEQIRISTLVAMSQNPTLKIIIIREGALMNTANLTMMSDLATEKGFQLWIEKFQEAPSNVGLHIVDGAIAFEDGEAVAESVTAE